MLNCKQTTEVVSKRLDRELSWLQRFNLKLHLIICKHCRNYAKHLSFLHAFSNKADEQIEKRDQVLSNESKERLQEAIKKAQ